MADSTTNIDTIATSQADKETTANGFFDAASHAAAFGRRQSTTEALTWGYYGGRIGATSVANGTLALTASRTNYIVAHRTTGAVSASTAGTNWYNPQTYARLYKVTTSALAISSYEDHRAGKRGLTTLAFGDPLPGDRIMLPIQVGDVGTTITTGTGKAAIRVPVAMYLTGVRGSLATASTSGAVTLDINDSGNSLLSTKLTLDQDEKTSTTAATAAVISSDANALADDTEITIDIDGAGTGAKGPVVWLYGIQGVGDPAYDLVQSYLSMEGANGGTTWTDYISGVTWTGGSSVATSTAQSLSSVSSAFAASSTYFGTSNQYLRSSASDNFDPSTAPWTAELWFRAASLANTPLLITIGTSSTNRLNVSAVSGKLSLYTHTPAAGGADRFTGGTTCSTGTWYFVELNWDGTTARLYIDGVSQGSYAGSVIPTGSCQIDLGNYVYSAQAAYVLDGYMQRFRYTRGLARHTSAYTRPFKPWPNY